MIWLNYVMSALRIVWRSYFPKRELEPTCLFGYWWHCSWMNMPHEWNLRLSHDQIRFVQTVRENWGNYHSSFLSNMTHGLAFFINHWHSDVIRAFSIRITALLTYLLIPVVRNLKGIASAILEMKEPPNTKFVASKGYSWWLINYFNLYKLFLPWHLRYSNTIIKFCSV